MIDTSIVRVLSEKENGDLVKKAGKTLAIKNKYDIIIPVVSTQSNGVLTNEKAIIKEALIYEY